MVPRSGSDDGRRPGAAAAPAGARRAALRAGGHQHVGGRVHSRRGRGAGGGPCTARAGLPTAHAGAQGEPEALPARRGVRGGRGVGPGVRHAAVLALGVHVAALRRPRAVHGRLAPRAGGQGRRCRPAGRGGVRRAARHRRRRGERRGLGEGLVAVPRPAGRRRPPRRRRPPVPPPGVAPGDAGGGGAAEAAHAAAAGVPDGCRHGHPGVHQAVAARPRCDGRGAGGARQHNAVPDPEAFRLRGDDGGRLLHRGLPHACGRVQHVHGVAGRHAGAQLGPQAAGDVRGGVRQAGELQAAEGGGG
mmetsp:Transcript_25110/g.85969  ORF Transcript_25110/g.85969 Transcript_25110/m.85969 type:complete len:303 (+) Transcript_25110:635-1543(+)